MQRSDLSCLYTGDIPAGVRSFCIRFLNAAYWTNRRGTKSTISHGRVSLSIIQSAVRHGPNFRS